MKIAQGAGYARRSIGGAVVAVLVRVASRRLNKKEVGPRESSGRHFGLTFRSLMRYFR